MVHCNKRIIQATITGQFLPVTDNKNDFKTVYPLLHIKFSVTYHFLVK